MARRTEIDHVLERASLTNLFDAVVSAEDATACKPDPACYNSGLEFLNRRRGEALTMASIMTPLKSKKTA